MCIREESAQSRGFQSLFKRKASPEMAMMKRSASPLMAMKMAAPMKMEM